MKACPDFANELAVCSAVRQEPSAALSQHLADCSSCRATFEEFTRVAMVHARMAENLPTPQSRSRVCFDFISDSGGKRNKLNMLALAGATTAVLVALLLVIGRPGTPPDDVSTGVVPSKERADASESGAVSYRSPTWKSLREDINENSISIAVSSHSTSVSSAHLRIMDAYTANEW